ncbi:MAG: hypothetical protein LBB92_02670 [Endomicrobium sp.]|nr:hypothetical protein [Endomicrobium sp.]
MLLSVMLVLILIVFVVILFKLLIKGRCCYCITGKTRKLKEIRHVVAISYNLKNRQ